MKALKPKAPVARLKVRIPLLFEAEGEGATPVALVALLAVAVLLLVFYATGR